MDNVQEQRKMIIKFHVLLNKAGVDNEGKQDLLSGYGAESSKELTVEELEALCERLRQMATARERKAEAMRRRALRAVCQFCGSVEVADWAGWPKEKRIAYAKAIVCRAAGVDNFNRIGVDRLRSIAFAFEKQRKDMERVVAEAERILKGE